MTTEEYDKIRALFDKAMDLPADERRRFVDGNTPDNTLRSELLAMVEAGDDSLLLASASPPDVPEKKTSDGDGLPSQIGNYKILRELGRGGMGVVYLALRNDDVFHKVVALKVIRGSGATELNFVQRFKQERQILAGLDHPNIARILDGGNTPDGRPFYVMEYVAGSPIDKYCSRVNADVPARVRMVIEVCEAVEYLHTHAIVHRDIKPNNILVTPEGRVKLVDFGIAKVETIDGLIPSSSAPGQPTMIMTPGYASPEQIAGNPAGKSGDIYSLAVVLYQLLTGRLPYAGEDGQPNLAAQLSGADPARPSKHLTGGGKPATHTTDSRRLSHPDLDRVVLTALQRDPLRRYGTVQVFAEDLRRCLDGRPIAARPESWTYRFRKLVSRNRVAASLAVLVVVFAGAGAWMAVAVRMERAQLEAKEVETERLVGLLNANVARWMEPEQTVPAAEKVADVQAANRLMASDTLRTLAARVPDPQRVKRILAELKRFLQRADELSRDQPALRKEIALVYRQVGNFESTAPGGQIADKAQAAASYRRAATVAASIRPVEPSWADEQLSEISGRLQELGSPMNVSLGPASAPASAPAPPLPGEAAASLPPPLPPSPVEAGASSPPPLPSPRQAGASPAPPSPRQASASPPSPSPVPPRQASGSRPPPATIEARPLPRATTADVDSQEYTDMMQTLKATAANAERARGNLEALRNSLAGTGQAIRPDLLTSMSQIDSLIEDARASLSSSDVRSAENSLRRATYELQKLFKAVGR